MIYRPPGHWLVDSARLRTPPSLDDVRFCEVSVIGSGVLAESSGVRVEKDVSPTRVLWVSEDSARSRRARSRRCTVFCEVFVIACGVLAESSGLERSPCGDGASHRPDVTGI